MRLSLIFAAATLLASCSDLTNPPNPVTEADPLKPLSVNPPAHWRLLVDKPNFPVAMSIFNIPNPADPAGKESTNVVVAAYAADSKPAQDTLATTKKRFAKSNLTTRNQAGWEVESYSEIQGVTRYRFLDGTKVQVDKTLFIRLAWPTLPANAPDYDAEMQKSFDQLLSQVH